MWLWRVVFQTESVQPAWSGASKSKTWKITEFSPFVEKIYALRFHSFFSCSWSNASSLGKGDDTLFFSKSSAPYRHPWLTKVGLMGKYYTPSLYNTCRSVMNDLENAMQAAASLEPILNTELLVLIWCCLSIELRLFPWVMVVGTDRLPAEVWRRRGRLQTYTRRVVWRLQGKTY